MSTKINAEPTPPIIGAAMRFITSPPPPVLNIIGTSPSGKAHIHHNKVGNLLWKARNERFRLPKMRFEKGTNGRKANIQALFHFVWNRSPANAFLSHTP